MMMEETEPFDRLYLDKNNAVYVELRESVPQHQLDGIRFLFKHYKKKNPGVIMNDPSGYGKCLQVALFLNGIRSLLTSCVLILCDADAVQNWKAHFDMWTTFNDEVSTCSKNPFSKNLVHINSLENAYAFSRRNWEVVIIHSNNFSKEIMQINFKADFKIWVTSVDMKKYLKIFSSIYTWLYPNNKFLIEDFSADKYNRKDVLNKWVILEAFLEDVVIRRKDFLTPFKKQPNRDDFSLTAPIKQTRKNKDPTGTKVKRSKKKTTDENVDETRRENKNIAIHGLVSSSRVYQEMTFDADNSCSNELFNFTYTKTTAAKSDDKVDVEKFIREEKAIGSEEFGDYVIDDCSSPNKDDNFDTNEESNTLEYQIAIEDIIRSENALRKDVSQNDYVKNVMRFQEINRNITDDYRTGNDDIQKRNDDLFDQNDDFKNESNGIIGDGRKLLSHRILQDDYRVKKESLEQSEKTKNKTKVDIGGIESINKKFIRDDSEKMNKELPKASGTTDDVRLKKTIYEKMTELEDEIAEKFKGSILDSIFRRRDLN